MLFFCPEAIRIFTKTKIFMFNPLNGAVDEIDKALSDILFDSKKYTNLESKLIQQLFERKYLFFTENDYQQYKREIFSYLDEFDKLSPPHFVILPSYKCNLKCHYCFEGKITSDNDIMSSYTLKSVFDFMTSILSQGTWNNLQRSSITLFGGEPLLLDSYPIVEEVLGYAERSNLSVEIVTNGTTLIEYESLLDNKSVQCVHITVDGSREVHNARRVFRDGTETFDIILNGIRMLVNKGIKVTIRINVDEEVIDSLPELGKLLKGEFKVGVNVFPYIYGLSETGCTGQELFINEPELVSRIIKLTSKHPEMSVFEWRFHGFLNINPVLSDVQYYPVQTYCGATRNQLVFAPDGSIYKCLFGVGRKEYTVGHSINNFLDQKKIELWKSRNIKSIKKCTTCKFGMICGGGCTHKAFDRTGKILEPNCPDFERLLPLYFSKMT